MKKETSHTCSKHNRPLHMLANIGRTRLYRRFIASTSKDKGIKKAKKQKRNDKHLLHVQKAQNDEDS